MSPKELFIRNTNNPIIKPGDIPYGANAVFNAGCTTFNNETLLLLRIEDKRGISHFTIARSTNGIDKWKIDAKPAMEPLPEAFPEERWGIEDPRITFLQDLNKWAVTYTAFSEDAPLVSIALTKDFITFERLGSVLPPENKDAALFPVKYNGNFAMIHRPAPRRAGSKPNMWISYSPDLRFWGKHRPLLKAREGPLWDSYKIGLSAQPIFTEKGWLILYHGVKSTSNGNIYRLGLALLDKNNPEKIISRTSEWIFGPVKPYERVGDVGNVTFSCGWLQKGEEVRLYYGAADSTLCLATAKLADLFKCL
jgi:predicted GH43/DUF377 family glycosyl hydrolase